MKNIFTFIFSTSFIFCSFITKAGMPLNGNTPFNITSATVKASGNAGTGSGITATNVEGFNFRLHTATSGPTMLIEVWDGAVGTGNGVAFYEATSSINPLFTSIIIQSNDGSRFDLLSLGVNAQNTAGGNANITITGLNSAGNPVSGATLSGTASVFTLTNFNVSGNNAFKGVYSIRITSSDIVYAFIDNISLANVGSTLPLNWVSFVAQKKEQSVVLNWSTAMESGTADFTIQHSVTAGDWKAIGTVQALGNSNTNQLYRFEHLLPNKGINHYRLLAKDVNGKQVYSKTLLVNMADQSFGLTIYPNPVVNSQLTVRLQKTANVQITNSNGMVVLQKQIAGEETLPLHHLPKGVYQITAGSEIKRFVIQ